MRSTLLASLLLSAALAACTGSGSVRYQAEYTAPELVEVEPGVQVIADYDEPVFYSDNYYWRYNAGIWYRSSDYRRDWVRVERPAPRVARISRPEVYVHYRANVRADVRDRRDNDRRDDRTWQPGGAQPQPQPQPSGPVIREHGDRTWQPGGAQPQAQPPQPQPQPQWQPPPDKAERKDEKREMKEERKDDRRDAREERKDDRRDMKEERKDDKRDRKDDRRDEKQERKDDKKRGR